MAKRETEADFWTRNSRGQWRTARKKKVCGNKNIHGPGKHCKNEINPGDRYFDSGEPTTWPSTMPFCQKCADRKVTCVCGRLLEQGYNTFCKECCSFPRDQNGMPIRPD